MTEQENQKELPANFPKIPRDVVSAVWEDWLSEKLDFEEMTKTVSDRDPFLYHILEGHLDQRGLRGGLVVYKMLTTAENNGITLPIVSQNVAATFISEIDMAHDLLGEVREIENHQELLNRHQEIHEKAKVLEHNFPSPIDYAEENPSLMVFIEAMSRSDLGLGASGMYVYELKRRQFLADQLERQLGSWE